MGYEPAPRIYTKALPQDEQGNAMHITNLLSEMQSYIERFESAISLCEESENFHREFVMQMALSGGGFPAPDSLARQSVLRSWKQMAMRDAAMTVEHFRWILMGVREEWGKCATLRQWVDPTLLKEAQAIFDRSFPDGPRVRHAVGHSGEMAKSLHSVSRHAYSGPVNDPRIPVGILFTSKGEEIPEVTGLTLNVVSDRTITATMRPKDSDKADIVSITVDHNALEALQETRRNIYAAFKPAEAGSLALLVAQEHRSGR